eukprot:m.56183 g.56183  ORF g.56183 m.56183 type:complete len:280 (-) comp11178_c0_seq1:2-841(-)
MRCHFIQVFIVLMGAHQKESEQLSKDPRSNLSFRTQLAMGVTATHGYVYGEAFPPKKVQWKSKKSKKKDGTPYAMPFGFRAHYDKTCFITFLNNLFLTLQEKKDEYKLPFFRKVVLVFDHAPEHGKEDEMVAAMNDHMKSISNCENLGKLIEVVKEQKKQIRHDNEDELDICSEDFDVEILYSSPISPQLNLCEYYNRSLRVYTNTMRHQTKFAAVLENPNLAQGTKIEMRIKSLLEIIKVGLKKLDDHGAQLSSFKTMEEFLKDTIRADGELNFEKKM